MEQLLTPEMLCNITGLKLQTIYNRVCTGGDLPPAIRLGRSLRWRQADVDTWIQSKAEPDALPDKHIPTPKRRRGAPTKAERMTARAKGVGPFR